MLFFLICCSFLGRNAFSSMVPTKLGYFLLKPPRDATSDSEFFGSGDGRVAPTGMELDWRLAQDASDFLNQANKANEGICPAPAKDHGRAIVDGRWLGGAGLFEVQLMHKVELDTFTDQIDQLFIHEFKFVGDIERNN